MTDSRHVAVLANPSRDHLVTDVMAALEPLAPTLLKPSSPDDIVDTVRAAVDGGVDAVVAVGGDGTQRSVAAGVLGTGAALGVVAGGTVNLLAQVLGLDDLDRSVAAIIGGSRRSIDVGRCNGQVFVLNTSTGYDATVIAEAATGHKEHFGRLSFVRAAVAAFRRVRPKQVTVTVDGEVLFDGRAMSVVVTNVAERSSSDLRVAPGALFDDGKLDVLVIRASTAVASMRLMWTIVRDREPSPDDLLRGAGASIDVTWSRPVDCQCDGDATDGSNRFEVRADHAALDVLV